MGLALTERQLIAAWKGVIKNHALLGLHADQLQDYQSELDLRLSKLQQAIAEDSFEPKLELSSPQVNECIAQEILRKALLKDLAPTDALEASARKIPSGFTVKLSDLVSRLSEDKISDYLQSAISKAELWPLLARYLQAGLLQPQNLRLARPEEAQGGMLAPLLVNFLINQLEIGLKKQGYRSYRLDAKTLLIHASLKGKAHLAKALSKKEGAVRPETVSNPTKKPADPSLQLGIQTLDKAEHWAFREGAAKVEERSDKQGMDIALDALNDVFDLD